MKFKRHQIQQCLFEQSKKDNTQENILNSVEHFFKNLGDQIPYDFKLRKQEINAIRSSLLKSVQLSFDCRSSCQHTPTFRDPTTISFVSPLAVQLPDNARTPIS